MVVRILAALAYRKYLLLFDRVLLLGVQLKLTKGGSMLPGRSQGKVLPAAVVAMEQESTGEVERFSQLA